MKRLIKKLFGMRPSFTAAGLVVSEVLLILSVIASAWLYRNWNALFGKDIWTVTQYGPRDINSMFYTIYNPKKGLLVVDGGWTEDAGYVREVLHSLGSHVDAWIITHPHPDHAGAFTQLQRLHSGIRTEKVYTVQMPPAEECLAVAPWDDMQPYLDFQALEINNMEYLYTGDELTIDGLQLKILSTFDEEVQERSKDYLNDGSMMFQVIGPEKTFLFCADVGKKMSKYLWKKYDASLKSDYVQMGHHGNGGLGKNFYTAVSPEKAFFDAPDWLMQDETGTYKTPEKIALMESLGSEIISFHSAPNTVTLG